MSAEKYIVRAFWGDRKEPLEECAARIVACCSKLATIDEAFRCWVPPGTTAQNRRRDYVPAPDTLASILERNRRRNRGLPAIIETLPYDVQLWNGLSDGEAIRVGIAIGGATAVATMPNPNSCVIDLPYSGDAAIRILSVDVLRMLLEGVVATLDATWGCVTSATLLQAMFVGAPHRDMVGWVTFLSKHYGPLPQLPDEFGVYQIGDMGHCISIRSNGRFSGSNPEHLGLATKLASILEGANLLRPTP